MILLGWKKKLKSWIMISWRMLQIPVNLTNLQRKKRLQKHFWKKKWIAGRIWKNLRQKYFNKMHKKVVKLSEN